MQSCADSNRGFLLDQLFAIVPLQSRGRPPYVYIEPKLVDAAEDRLLALDPAIRAVVPADDRKGLYDPRISHRGRQIARVILRANGIQPEVLRCTQKGQTTTRWSLGPLRAELHAKYLWPALTKPT